MVCKDRKKLKIEREKEKSMDRSLPFYQDSWGIGLIWVSGSKCMAHLRKRGILAETIAYSSSSSINVCTNFLNSIKEVMAM